MIIRMIWRPSCSSVPLQMVICKEDGSPDEKKQGDGGAGIVANDHPDDPASSVLLQMVICKEDCPPNDQNQRDREARIVANDHLDDLASSVLFCSFANKRFALLLGLVSKNFKAFMSFIQINKHFILRQFLADSKTAGN